MCLYFGKCSAGRGIALCCRPSVEQLGSPRGTRQTSLGGLAAEGPFRCLRAAFALTDNMPDCSGSGPARARQSSLPKGQSRAYDQQPPRLKTKRPTAEQVDPSGRGTAECRGGPPLGDACRSCGVQVRRWGPRGDVAASCTARSEGCYKSEIPIRSSRRGAGSVQKMWATAREREGSVQQGA